VTRRVWQRLDSLSSTVVYCLSFPWLQTNRAQSCLLIHVEARATRTEPESRRKSKLRLVKRLYERHWSAADVRQLFRVIDWLMGLPAELQEGFRQDVYQFEEERQMPYVTSIERLAKEEGREEGRKEGREEGRKEAVPALLTAVRTLLRQKFGTSGIRLMEKIKSMQDLAKLRELIVAAGKADSLKEVREKIESW
jgi:hypothetical protein